jgi:hypothetical protein
MSHAAYNHQMPLGLCLQAHSCLGDALRDASPLSRCDSQSSSLDQVMSDLWPMLQAEQPCPDARRLFQLNAGHAIASLSSAPGSPSHARVSAAVEVLLTTAGDCIGPLERVARETYDALGLMIESLGTDRAVLRPAEVEMDTSPACTSVEALLTVLGAAIGTLGPSLWRSCEAAPPVLLAPPLASPARASLEASTARLEAELTAMQACTGMAAYAGAPAPRALAGAVDAGAFAQLLARALAATQALPRSTGAQRSAVTCILVR